jgi:2,5-furandicarboxylate decarboxylase 1
LTQAGAGPAILFERVRGYDVPAVGNVLSSRRKMALALGVPTEELLPTLVRALDAPVAPRLVDAPPWPMKRAPMGAALQALFPIGRQCEGEQGPYLTSGVLVAEDPASRQRNVSLNRALLLPDGRLMIGMSPSHHLFRLARAAWAAGRVVPFAIAVGVHPALLLASNAYVRFGEDELGIAGALLGAPLDLVRGQTVDVAVPAAAEVVVEGELLPDTAHAEGPVPEFTGIYEDYGASPIARVCAIHHRRDALFQQIATSRSAEHMLIGAAMIEATTFRAIREVVPSVRDVRVPLGGAGRLHCVVALHDPLPGEAQRAVFAALAHANVLKHVTVVDDDVDLDDPADVEWAVATRARAERDVLLFPNRRADRCEPMKQDGTVTKWALVALKNRDRLSVGYERAQAPAAVRAAVAAHWDEYFA